MSVEAWLAGFYDARAHHGGVLMETVELFEAGDFLNLYEQDIEVLRELG